MSIDIVIGGSQKSGTTSVRNLLSAHPGVAGQLVDELGGLADPDAALGTARFEREWFAPGAGTRVAKLAGLMYRPEALARVHRAYPDALHLLVLRDPVDRAHSAFWHMRRVGRETAPDLGAALAAGPERFPPGDERLLCDYVRLSRYDLAVADVLEVVPRDQLVVVELDELHRSLEPIHDLARRAGLDPALLPDGLPRSNPAVRPRSRVLARTAAPGGAVRRASARLLPRPVRRRAGRTVRRANLTPLDVPVLDDDVRGRLQRDLAGTGAALSRILGQPIGTTWSTEIPAPRVSEGDAPR